MTLQRFCASGQAETMKGAAHVALGGLALLCAGYNALAYEVRVNKETRLLVNALIYSAVVGLEVVQVRRHWGAHDSM